MGRLFANVAKNNSNNRMRTSCRRCRDSSKAKPNATTLGMKEYGLDTSIYMRMEYQSTKMQAIDRNIRPELSHAKRSTNCFKSVGTKIVEQACQKLASYCVRTTNFGDIYARCARGLSSFLTRPSPFGFGMTRSPHKDVLDFCFLINVVGNNTVFRSPEAGMKRRNFGVMTN